MSETLKEHPPQARLVMKASSVLELPLTDRVTGWGPVHGGVLALVADVCCALGVRGVIDASRELPASTDLHVRYFKQPRQGPLRAEGTVVNRGAKGVAAECEIRDGAGRLIAKATGSYAVFEVEKRAEFIGPKDSASNRS